MRVGLIEGVEHPLPAALERALAGVDWLLLAGGLGSDAALEALTRIAPLTAVVGHEDFLAFGDRFPETAEIELGGARVLLTHMVGSPADPLPPIRRRLEADPPDIVAHGHENAPSARWVGGALFVCPGRVMPDRPGRTGACALLDIAGPGRITVHILDLD